MNNAKLTGLIDAVEKAKSELRNALSTDLNELVDWRPVYWTQIDDGDKIVFSNSPLTFENGKVVQNKQTDLLPINKVEFKCDDFTIIQLWDLHFEYEEFYTVVFDNSRHQTS